MAGCSGMETLLGRNSEADLQASALPRYRPDRNAVQACGGTSGGAVTLRSGRQASDLPLALTHQQGCDLG